MKCLLSAPSKTFLLGEYAALHSGPALVLSSTPRFELSVEACAQTEPVTYRGITTASPAGKFIETHAAAFTGCHLEFHDPHRGAGGFGASSAQFLLVAALKQGLVAQNLDLQWSVEQLLARYLSHAWQGEGIAPSGADLIAQAQGGLTYFHRAAQQLEKLAWPFAELNYYLLSTGNKLATHQHLAALAKPNTSTLAALTLLGRQHLANSDANGFIATVNQFAAELQALNLVSPATQQQLERVRTCTAVVAAKGCGALGADVILVLVAAERAAEFSTWLCMEPTLNLVTCSNTVAAGLQITTEVKLTL